MSPSVIVSAILAFFSTTIDDFAVLLIFFAEAQKMENPYVGFMKVIIGDIIGFTIVVLISLIGLVAGLLFPDGYVALIGFLPIIIGIIKGYEVLHEDGYCFTTCSENNDNIFCNCLNNTCDVLNSWLFCFYDEVKKKDYVEIPNVDDESGRDNNDNGNSSNRIAQTGLEVSNLDAINPITDGQIGTQLSDNNIDENNTIDVSNNSNSNVNDTMKERSDDEEEEESNGLIDTVLRTICSSCVDPFTLSVIIMMLVCSSDNIGIYIALFATFSASEVSLAILFFYILLAVNIIVALALIEVSVLKSLSHFSKNRLSKNFLKYDNLLVFHVVNI